MVPAVQSKDVPISAIELYDGPNGAAFVQLTGLLINGKAEVRSCAGVAQINKSNYGKLPKITLSPSVTSLERDSKGTMTLTRGAGSECVVPSNLKFEKDESLTPAQLADRAALTGQVLSSSVPGVTSLPPFKPTVKIVFVQAPDTELAEYLRADRAQSIAQWQDYLAQKGEQPKVFEALKIEIDPQHEVSFRSDRYELEVKPELVKLSKDSMLFLDFGFSREGDGASWRVNRVVVSENLHTNNWVHAARRSEPPGSLPQGFQDSWTKLKTGSFPYNGMIESENGQTRVSAAAQGSGPDARVRYGLEVSMEGVQPQAAMTRKLDLLQRSFKMLEPGTGK